jgi:hypothetical protein
MFFTTGNEASNDDVVKQFIADKLNSMDIYVKRIERDGVGFVSAIYLGMK